MQLAKIDSLTRYTDLLKSAKKAQPDFPERLCDFITDEFELQALVLFKVQNGKELRVLGKSGDTKKIYIKNTIFTCNACAHFKGGNSPFEVNEDCEVLASEYVMYEGCAVFNINDTNKGMFKVGRKTPFQRSDKENFEFIAAAAGQLLNIWMDGDGPGNTAGLCNVISDIAHELRTPTNSIMGFASLLNEEKLTSAQAEYVATLKDSAFNLLSLQNDLIDLAKIEAGSTKPVISAVNIRTMLNEIVRIFNDKLERGRIEFLTSIDAQIPDVVRTDGQKLRAILVNTITYCLRLTERGKVSITVTAPAKGKLHFRVADTGSGLPMSKLREVFKPFSLHELGNSRLGNTTGLGLMLAKQYVEILGGQFEVTSSLGKGTTYSFTLNAEMIGGIEQHLTQLPKATAGRNKVLVVEDDYATSKLLSNYLNKWGYEPMIVNSAEQALKTIEKESFLAVLMDIVLPDANGFELLKSIREHKNTKNTPVIVCSVEAEQQKAFMMGAVEYFVKPIKYKYLVEVLTSYRLKKDSNILIVDDDVPTLNLIKSAVEQAGFVAIAEPKSIKVEAMIENMELDLAIIDLDMPDVNGFDLIKTIKSNPKFAKLPVIIYTGKENFQEDLKKIDGLFADLLHKSSSNMEDLAGVVMEMINRFDEPAKPEEVKAQKEGIKILLVEDYKHSQIIVTRLLKKNNFEQIVVVENGQEALDQAKEQKYDLILMDMQMPVMNGFIATEKIRLLPQYKETPIIALTAFAMKGDREKCLEAGATDYIPKPIDSQEFIEKVKYYTANVIV